MPGCDTCTAEGNGCPDTLEALQSVCNAHAMEMCGNYNHMCSVNGMAMEYFCGSRSGTFDPPMRMYFHKGLRPPLMHSKRLCIASRCFSW
jgi:hypothetical protein